MPHIQTDFLRQSSEPYLRSASPHAQTQTHVATEGMWERLSRIGTQLQDIISPSEIDSNPSEVICPVRTAVAVDIGSGEDQKSSWIHANIIEFVREKFVPVKTKSSLVKTKIAIAGQSPKTFNQTEKVVTQALDSGNGIVHVVSSIDERMRRKNPKATIIEQLLVEHDRCVRLNQPMILGGRYEVISLIDQSINDGHRNFVLTASDVRAGGKIKTVPLTQIGLAFSDHVLHVEQLEEANALIEKHLASRDWQSMTASSELLDPNIVSNAGIGRNAAVITYRECLSRIRAGMRADELDDMLEQIVAQGRHDRGPKYLHSRAQLEEVRAALWKAIQEQVSDFFPQPHPADGMSQPPRPLRYAKTLGAPTHDKATNVLSHSSCIAGAPLQMAEVGHRLPHAQRNRASHQHVVPDEVKDEVDVEFGIAVSDVECVTPTEIADPPRERVLACLRDYASEKSLPLFDALARVNIEAAAFCAVQVQRMMTPTDEPGQFPHMRKSMHVNIDVTAPEDTSVHHGLSEPDLVMVRPDDNDGDAYRKPSSQPATALIIDVEQAAAKDPKNSSQLRDKSCGLFPDGLATALEQGQLVNQHDQHGGVERLNVEQVLSLLVMSKEDSVLQLIERLAPNNHAAAALIHFIDQGLLIRGAPDKIQTARFQYASQDDRIALGLKRDQADEYFPTFLAGVERAFKKNSAFDEKWQIEVESEKRTLISRPKVIASVIDNAVAQLTSPPDDVDENKIYPTLVYELLVKIDESLQIPSKIFAHERDLIANVKENKEKVSRRESDNRLTFRIKEDEAKKRRRIAAEEGRKQHIAEGFNTPLQAQAGAASYSQELVGKSVDGRISLIGDSGDSSISNRVRAHLENTHEKQVIDNMGVRRGGDKRSWLRASWLSVLSSVTSPDQLAHHFSSMPSDSNVKNLGRKIDCIKAISHYFLDNPRAFMQGVMPGDAQIDTEVMPRYKNLQHSAQLGCRTQMSYVLDKWLPEDFDRGASDDSIEDFLMSIQKDIAAAFRSTDPGIMPFLASTLMGYENTGSTIPVALHRGLGVPVMVIEQGTNDRFSDEGVPYLVPFNDIRLAAPVGSDLAEQVTSLMGKTTVDPSAVQALLERFNDKPVIWLEHGSYSLYLPKRLTSAPDERDVVPAFDALEDVEQSPIANTRSDDPYVQSDPASPKAGWVGSARNMWHQFSGRSP